MKKSYLPSLRQFNRRHSGLRLITVINVIIESRALRVREEIICRGESTAIYVLLSGVDLPNDASSILYFVVFVKIVKLLRLNAC